MLSVKRLAGVGPEVDLRQHILFSPVRFEEGRSQSRVETQSWRHQKLRKGGTSGPKIGHVNLFAKTK